MSWRSFVCERGAFNEQAMATDCAKRGIYLVDLLLFSVQLGVIITLIFPAGQPTKPCAFPFNIPFPERFLDNNHSLPGKVQSMCVEPLR